MRIVLTGAGGFIGSHLATSLIASGHKVTGVDNFVTGRRSNLDHLKHHPTFQLFEHDVIHPMDIGGPVDWIMHFASPASPPKYLDMPLETMRVNGEGTRHLLDLAREKGAKFFLASTSEVYGDPSVHPQPEDYWGHVNCAGPRGVYDEAKRYAETLTYAYHHHYGISTRVIRIFNTYGPRMDPYDGRVVTNFIRQALAREDLTIYGEGSQTRSFQFVDDLIAGIRRLMDVEHYQPVNLGNPDEYTIRQLAELVLELTGAESKLVRNPLPVDDPRQRCPNIKKAMDLLGWRPKVPVRQGLMATIEHMRTTAEASMTAAVPV